MGRERTLRTKKRVSAHRQLVDRVQHEPLRGRAHGRVRRPSVRVSGVPHAQFGPRRAGTRTVHVRRRVAVDEPTAGRRPTAGRDVRAGGQLDRGAFRERRLVADRHGPQLKPARHVPFRLAQVHVAARTRRVQSTARRNDANALRRPVRIYGSFGRHAIKRRHERSNAVYWRLLTCRRCVTVGRHRI